MGSANFNDRSQRGDGDSEIALVVEDTDRIESSMDGQQYMASRFAATLRRKLYRGLCPIIGTFDSLRQICCCLEHLGLISPQNVHGKDQERTSFMHPAPIPNEDETGLEEDAIVADPLSPDLLALWQSTAKKNRDIYTELFMPVPTDLVQNISVYKSYKPKVKYGHLIPQISLERAKQKLGQVRGQLVEMPLLFLIDEKEITDNPEWSVLNPTLPIYL
ncbi:hypothetical protein Clacol_008711 [Clathrus columnatus]|uniref:Phospholipase D n=1 Tax=Clathrus columnatus TaxID=1419009 RepID=A0AAV5AIH1_9AGAM|nr:hypothetical protein Clacol_008711 [Clathrus columnatus]